MGCVAHARADEKEEREHDDEKRVDPARGEGDMERRVMPAEAGIQKNKDKGGEIDSLPPLLINTD
jgi:hypothetical protein